MQETVKKNIKKAAMGALVVVGVVVLAYAIYLGVFWFQFGKQVTIDQRIIAEDALGKEFIAVHLDSYNYEFTNEDSIHSNQISGTTNVVLLIPRNGKAEEYTLTCADTISGKQYFEYKGVSSEMIAAIKEKSCFENDTTGKPGQ